MTFGDPTRICEMIGVPPVRIPKSGGNLEVA